jgi:hypothetical protein
MIVLSLAALLVAAAAAYASDIDISIKISPNVLNLGRPGDCLTVHTDIGFSQVVGASVMLNGVAVQSWKSDNRGQFVAKFDMADIVDLPLEVGAYNRFELTGETTAGETFCGGQEIMVINNTSGAR